MNKSISIVLFKSFCIQKTSQPHCKAPSFLFQVQKISLCEAEHGDGENLVIYLFQMRWKSQAFRKYLLSTSLGQITGKTKERRSLTRTFHCFMGFHMVNPLNQREKMALFEATNKQVQGFSSLAYRIIWSPNFGGPKAGLGETFKTKNRDLRFVLFLVTSIKIGDLQSFFLRTEKDEICA